jgi:Tfp pilus assembly protein PilE
MIDSKTEQHLTLQEAGMVSIVITFILMIVLSITVMGFAQIIRRSERQALDTQLSTQAFYAAQYRQNTAKYIMTKEGYELTKNECGGKLGTSTVPYDIDASTNTKVTCLLVKSDLQNYVYDLSPGSGSAVVPLKSATAANITALNFTWDKGALTGDDLAKCNKTTNPPQGPSTAWGCPYGLLRLDLLPVSGITSGDRNTMMGKTYTAFIYPKSQPGPASVSYALGAGTNIYGGTAAQGVKVESACDDTNCSISITGLPAETQHYLRISTLYRSTKVSITPNVKVIGAQVLVDSTGKAQDVLRRIQVRVPVNGGVSQEDYALDTTDSLCKQFSTYPNISYSDACD